MNGYDIYGIGAALVDTEIEVSDEDLKALGIDKGVMTLVSEQRQHELITALSQHLETSRKACGGSGANSVIAASYFGAKNFYSCRVANDDNGLFYLSDLEAAGIDYHNTNGSMDGITGKCLVMITPDAERTMNTFLGASEHISESDIDHDALKQSRYAYIEGYLVTSTTGQPAAVKLREQAQALGVKTALSLSDPAIVKHFHSGLLEMIGSGVDILFCNEDEAINFTHTSNVSEATKAMKKFAHSFAITLGKRGALLYDGSQTIEVSPYPAERIDTNGAGDMFAGAFLFGISRGMDFASAGALANKAAAKVVSQFGPRLAAQDYRELLQG